MKIDGKSIAEEILNSLTADVSALKEKNITPTLAVILIGNNESSKSYIKQKELKAAQIGAKIKLFHFQSLTQEKLLKLIDELNLDPKIHGIIVQRPLPLEIDRSVISLAVNPSKDVDGFNPQSNFDAPVALAVERILKSVKIDDLNNYKITVIGKGETAGGPIINYLKKNGLNPQVIDRKTENPGQIIKNSPIIISAAGKERVIKPEYLNKNQILIGVGLFQKDGKLKGDYEVSEIVEKVKYFTPTLGGVGPVNVSFLMKNLVGAALLK
jgi:methylenetetrahydrofolate dehydrogenase (NADP+) / methenyltetrahydrofolate cyclohydrolase